MSIETRLNAINDHLVDDYSVLTLAGADLTNVDKNIVNLKPTWKERLLYFMNNGTDVVWDNWEKVVGEGTELTLSNTEQAPMKVLLKGNTYQDSTTGKNILDLTTSQTTVGGIPISVEDGVIKLNGITSSSIANWYCRVFQTNSGNAIFSLEVTGYTDKDGNNASLLVQQNTENASTGWTTLGEINLKSNQPKQVSVTLDNTKYYRVRLFTSENTFTNATIKAQLEYGTTKTDWEPYTNGASPNPDYPQEVHVVSGDNEVEVVGKNYLPYTSRSAINGISTTANDNGSMTISGTATSSWCVVGNEYVPVKPIPPGTYTFSTKEALDFAIRLDLIYTDDSTENTFTISKGNLSRTITTTKTIRSIRIEITSGLVSGTTYNQTLYLQLEKGSSATNWVKHQSTTYPINLPEGMFLGSIGDYKDRFFKTSGKNLINLVDFLSKAPSYTKITDNTYSFSTGGTFYTKGLEVDIAQPFTISYNITNGTGTSFRIRYIWADGTATSGTNSGSGTTTQTITQTFTNEHGNLKEIRGDWGTGGTFTISNFMVNSGSSSIPYEPYGSNEWYLEKKIGKRTLTGNETLIGYSSTTTRTYWQIDFTSYGIYQYLNSLAEPIILATKFKPRPQSGSFYPNQIALTTTYRYVFFIFEPNTTEEQARAILTDMPVYFGLATPTYTKIDGTLASQLEALNGAKSYTGQTNISQTNNDLPFVLSVSVLKEIN